MTSPSQELVNDPSVIVGAACRVPGATNINNLWDVLEKRKDLQRKMPAERFNADAFYHPAGTNKGTSNARLGYYLDQGLDQFDASFFSISGKEAEAMDPQQRILLEVVYEALENSGITLDDVRGSRTSVFVGSFTNDYQSMTHRDLTDYPKYSITGLSTNTILANRISYFFDLHGPSLQLDTACSSSLTGFHLGVQSLLTGESDMAIICGSALHFDPTIFVTMTDFGMLSTDGRCRHFDANASGYVRGDGVCALILKRQHAAELNGDSIRAIIRGTGINHDGTKEGITLPNPTAQADLVRSVYKSAGILPKDTGYFEAHGTGTKAGDPREAAGIGSVFAADRTEPLLVGSIKTNIGHLEGASGLAGVIKAMLSVEKGKIIPNMHFNTPNPDIDFEALNIKVPEDVLDWNAALRRASINSFGFGGSNAHVVLENYHKPMSDLTPPDSPELHAVVTRPYLLPLTSHSEHGGELLQREIIKFIRANPDMNPRDLVCSYGKRRTLHPVRAYTIGSSLTELCDAASKLAPEAKWKRANHKPRLGFVFTGQGAQWWGMGRQLIEDNLYFRQVLLECEAHLKSLPDAPAWSIVTELTKSEGNSRLSQSEYSQPLCTALQIALVDLLKLWGIEPNAVVGHSSGEIAAAYAAGALSRKDAIVCAFYRGLYMSKGSQDGGIRGGMMAVGLTEAEAAIALEPYKGRAVIAAINSPSSITLSGDEDAMKEIKHKLDEDKVFARMLKVEQAFHSHHMVPLAPAFEKALATSESFSPEPAKVRMFSSVTARVSEARSMDSSYWSDNMTGTVRFSDALTGAMLDEDEELTADILIEIGPHAALKGPARQTLKALGIDLPYLSSLDRKAPAYESMLSCAGQLFALGYGVNLDAVNSDFILSPNGDAVRTVVGNMLNNLPTYTWDHKSYWAETRLGKEFRQRTHRHSLLGAPVPGLSSKNPSWRNYVRKSELPWIPDHSIDGKVVFPGAGYFAMAIEAIVQTAPADASGDVVLRDVRLKSALILPDTDAGVEMMLTLSMLDAESSAEHPCYSFSVLSFTDDGATVDHCSGTISLATNASQPTSSDYSLEEYQSQSLFHQPVRSFYKNLFQVGLQYGQSFQLLSDAIESAPGFAVAPLECDSSKIPGQNADDFDDYVLHPTLMDSAFHVIFAALESSLGHALDDAYVPTFCRSLRVSNSMISRRRERAVQKHWVVAKTEVGNTRSNSSELIVHDMGSKARVVELQGLELTALGLARSKKSRNPFFRIRWKEAFDTLGLNDIQASFSGLNELLHCYSHQYPEGRVLHIPSASPDVPEGSEFDLIVVHDGLYHSTGKLLKPNGFVITTDKDCVIADLKPKFSHGAITIWQASSGQDLLLPEQLTLLLASSPSADTMKLAQAIQGFSSLCKVSITTLDRLDNIAVSDKNFISLVGLDQDILSAASQTSVQFDALKKILCAPNKQLIWLYKKIDTILGVPTQSLISGLARSARLENESLRLVTLEVSPIYATQNVCDWIQHIFASSSSDDEFVLTGNRFLIPRVEAYDKPLQDLSEQDSTSLVHGSTTLDPLESSFSPIDGYTGLPRGEGSSIDAVAPLGEGEVEIIVKASSLIREGAITSCVGIVANMHGELRGLGLQQGAEAFVLSINNSIQVPVLRTKSDMVRMITPPTHQAHAVASLTVPLMKVAYVIHELARLRDDDVCLVHNAMSATGQMAISLAQRVGAKIMASVYQEEERSYLMQKFGIPSGSIAVSKDGEPQLPAGDQKYRLLISCDAADTPNYLLSVSHLVAQLQDKTDSILVGLQNGSSATFTTVNLATVFSEDAHLAGRLLDASLDLLHEGKVSIPSRIPGSSYDATQAEALADVLTGSGKKATLFDAEKTYLIVGGLGGLGRTLDQWMFRKGARKFAFLARSGADKPEAQKIVKWLQLRGASVAVSRGSVSDEAAVHDWVASIEGDIGGVFQAATTLYSGLLANMTPSSWQSSLDPKVKGSLNLHFATINRSLDFFVCFSSLLAVTGFAAEANYSAANGFMDHFAAWRREQGLPSSSLNIGVVADAGLVAEDEKKMAGMQRVGMDTISEEELLLQLQHAVLEQHSAGSVDGVAHHQLVSGINVTTKDLFWASKPLFSKLYANVDTFGSSTTSDQGSSLLSCIHGAENAEKATDVLGEAFIDKIARSLSIQAADIHLGLPLSAFGMDSLVAVDFRKWFSVELDVNLALFDILGAKTARLLVEKVCEIVLSREQVSQVESPEKAEKQTVSSEEQNVVAVRDRPSHLPLSSFQKRLWFMDNIMEKQGGLNVGTTLTIKGEPQFDSIKRTFHEFARRNETLRTRYFEGDDFAEQEVLSTLPTDVELVDLSHLPDALAKGQDQLKELMQEPMDLELGQVIRSRLVKLAESSYVWLFSIHHIAVDGGSRESFMEQLVSCYNDVRSEAELSSLASIPSYVDFTLWHEEVLKSPKILSDLAWFREHLKGAPSTSALMPFAQNDRPEKASDLRRTISAKITNTTLRRMKRICSSVDTTPFHFVLAALRAFLFRYTSEQDVTLLIMNGERPHSSFDRLVGFFVNIIPLRWRGALEDTFESLVTEAKSLTVEAMAHSQAPFDSIVDSLELGWNPKHFPLGQVALNYQMYTKSPHYTTSDFEISDVHITDVPTACEMQFEVMEDPKTGLGFRLDYDTYLYGAPEMDRFLENFMTFIESAVRDFRQPIEQIDMCGQQELDFLRSTCWLEHVSNLPAMNVPLWERFLQVVSEQPQAIAVKDSEGNSITYKALQAKAEKTAMLLQSSGISQGDRVGVLCQPSIDAIAAMLSTAYLRCTYVPLDPNYAQGRLEYMVQDTTPTLILYGPGLDALVSFLKESSKRPFISLTEPPQTRTLAPRSGSAGADDVFYIVYTSGSTGTPKGIMVSHENTRAMLCGRNQALDLRKSDVFLSQSSISFDISITQTWGSFLSGATVALVNNNTKQDIEALAAFIHDAAVSMVFMTPTQFAMIMESSLETLRECQSLRAVSLIGEHLLPRLVKQIYDLQIPVKVYNEYGPSETTSQNTLHKVAYPSPDQRTIDVGRPLPNNSAYIVNSKLKPVPAGVNGEVCLGGPQISLGYLGKKFSKSSPFMRNPFVSGTYKANGWDRLYRTGDLGRFRQDGLIDLQGRMSGDKQIKLRGNRLDLSEIETEIHRILSESEQILFKGIVVIPRMLDQPAEDSLTDDRQLVAFIATKIHYSRPERQRVVNRLQAELKKTLNGYMVPAYYELMETLPNTLSGKIDRVKLAQMKLDLASDQESNNAEEVAKEEESEEVALVATPVQGVLEIIKSLFVSILKLPVNKAIHDNDSFFDLGGQSVLAMRLQKSLKTKLKVPIKLKDIFTNPTPAGLADVLAPDSSSLAPESNAVLVTADVNWDEETRLPDDERYWPRNANSVSTTSNAAISSLSNGAASEGILLIGADGFVGYYLLKYLLTLHRGAKIHLISLSDRFNLGDLFAAFMDHQLFDAHVTQADLLSRTEIVRGSMGLPKFGLSPAAFIALGQSVQTIYHTGGFVSLLATYSTLRSQNVQSTLDMISLAALGNGVATTSMHYISSWSVIHLQTWNTTKSSKSSVWTDEQSAASFQPPSSDDHGYFKTRWVAELLLEEAARRGFPATIFRCPAHTVPIGSQAVTPVDNFTINQYLSMVTTGLILKTADRPDGMESDIGMMPIDYLADTLVRLAGTEEARAVSGEALRLHVVNPNPLPFSKASSVIAQVRDDGRPGQLLDTDEWFQAITASSSETANLGWATYKEYLDKGHLMFTLDDRGTRPLLDKIDREGDDRRVKCPPVNATYLRSILKQSGLSLRS